MTLGAALVVAGAMVSAQSPSPTEDSVELRARELYASAEYDLALSVIGDSQEPAAQQYRALCLLALGRQADAEAALKRLIASAPEFTLSAEDMPPRFITLFAQQRRKLVHAGQERDEVDRRDAALQYFPGNPVVRCIEPSHPVHMT